MTPFLAPLCFVGLFLIIMTQCTVPASEFQLDGDYLIGGLFDIHSVSRPHYQNRPETLSCSSEVFLLPNYRRFLLMRFSIEEINNSTSLLPDVALGYEMFDHCSITQNFPNIFKLISANEMVTPWAEQRNLSKVIGVVGPFTSSPSLTVAPLIMAKLLPMVSYGSRATVFSNKRDYPYFLRTVHPSKIMINGIVNIILHFNWRWVAFLNSDDDFGIDGLDLFIERIKDTNICLAYNKGLNSDTNHSQIFQHIDMHEIKIIVVFAPKIVAEAVVESAIKLNVNKKVWIADDGWSLNKILPKMEGINTIGTVLGVAQPVITFPGFNEYLYFMKSQTPSGNAEQRGFCNQVCNCSDVSVDDITATDPSFSFSVYAAVYAIAHALHNTLKCGDGTCENITVDSHMVIDELKRSNFTLLNQTVQFDENGDPKFGSYSIVFWNDRNGVDEIGFYNFYPSVKFYINASKIQWYSDREVPIALCSNECPEGYTQKQTGVHKCCFNCEICPGNTYVNSTEDPFKCIDCMDTEWSPAGSTSCSLRLVEYVPVTDTGAIVIMVGTCLLVGLSVAISVLFAINYNTPVVRSAGGTMCFLILTCLSLCSLSVFFYFGKPTPVSCILRYFPFILFYTVCLACFVVRSFQIVCIFKMAAQIPKLHSLWMKYHGQWLFITVVFLIQATLLMSLFYDPPRPYNETSWYPDQIVLFCSWNLEIGTCTLFLPLLLCFTCFVFSYMGKDLPKNYNEAKVITFCLLLLIFTWIFFVTAYMLYHGKYIQTLNALAVLSSLCSFLLWYFLPKCFIIIFQPHKNTQQYFQGLIQNYTKKISQ